MSASFPSDAELAAFVVREARLIDEQRFDEWLDLYDENGHYWMPLEYGQADPRSGNSLMYEDKLLLRIRCERLKGARTFSQKPKSRCCHVLQAPTVDRRDEAGNLTSRIPPSLCRDALRRTAALRGVAKHHIMVVDGALKIRLKRVDLVNCDAAFGNIQLFM